MTRADEIRKRIENLEQAVNHLRSHHDEEYLVVHDDVSADTCKRLYRRNTLAQRKRKPKRMKRKT